mmetsp:Transcript_2344/g.4944  ORF Transcript_2344/g.4944 Transcript_2344/m.4944 type:complete len:206 (-) Transcript_2344:769-1386(-)
MSMSTEIEEDDLPSASRLRLANRCSYGMICFWCREDAFCFAKERPSVEGLLLFNANSIKLANLLQVTDQRSHCVVSQATGMARRWHEVMAKSMTLDQWGQAGCVAKVVGILALCERWAVRRLSRDHFELLRRLLPEALTQEREAQAREVGATASAAHNDIWILAYHLQLLHCLHAENGLVHEDMVEDTAQSILVLLHCRSSFNGF